MTEPIEAEARAYVEEYRENKFSEDLYPFQLIVGLLAEIARLSSPPGAAAAALEEAAEIARGYAINPVGDERNNTLEAFQQGMNHQAGAIDNATAILAAICALAAKPESEP